MDRRILFHLETVVYAQGTNRVNLGATSRHEGCAQANFIGPRAGVEPTALRPVVAQQNSNPDLLVEAKDATAFEHQMTPREAFKIYPKAVAWSILLSAAITMEGYDTILLGSFYGFPSFVQKFGTLQPDGTYSISAAWQAGLSNGAQVGEIVRLFYAGYASERFGYRKTMISALLAIIAFIFIQFFAPNIQTLQAAYVLCGLTSYVNLCWVIGQLLASAVLRLKLSRLLCRPVVLANTPIIGVWFAPESPWWLLLHGRTEEAAKTIDRLVTSTRSDSNTEQKVAMMFYTNELERKAAEGTSFLDCLKRTDLRRTEIASVVWFTQAFCGTALIGYSTYFYEQAGLPTTQSFNFTLIQSSIGIIGTIFSWIL
ncbi:major facilitator superfamily domain-containing protein [Lipomyces tetrasporus]